MIEVQNLTKRFGPLTAVDNISFDIEAGESVALWGKNGAGKTTALRCLLGVIPYEGSVRLGGFDTAKQGKDARRMLGFVPQEISFHDNLSVEETLYFYSRLKKTANDTEHAIGLLERLGLVDHVHKKVGDLSGGMKQRLALVIALAGDHPGRTDGQPGCQSTRGIPGSPDGVETRGEDTHIFLSPSGGSDRPRRTSPGHRIR